MAATRRSFGTHPDIPDHRDHLYSVPLPMKRALPDRVDLRPRCPPVFDQKHLNSCSANAIAGALWFDQIKQHTHPHLEPSRLFIYYNERAREGEIRHNVPVSLRDGYKSVARNGVCSEELWPYRTRRFRRRPPTRCYRAALEHRAIAYFRIGHDLDQIKGCLAEGYPVVMAISVYESFKSRQVARSGRVSMPGRHERLLGGHAVLAVGYVESRQWFLVRNSWGVRWGIDGYCTLPYSYVLHPGLSWDFWTVRKVL